MTNRVKNMLAKGFRIYFALVLLGFTAIVFLMNVRGVFAAEKPAAPKKQAVAAKVLDPTPPLTLASHFHEWKVASETQVKFRGNKMMLQIRF